MSVTALPVAGPEATDTPEEPVFDRASLLERARGDRRVSERVLQVFTLEAAALVRAMGAALRRGNLGFAGEFAYTLRVAAANAGAMRIARAATLLGRAARGSAGGDCESTLRQLESELGRFQAEVTLETGRVATEDDR
jgi:hypothetical protein